MDAESTRSDLLDHIEKIERENRELHTRVTELQTLGSKHVMERQARDRFGGRKRRQMVVFKWAARVFGACTLSPMERALRILEEAIEVAQAAGVSEDTTRRMADRVYSRSMGVLRDEVGGLLVTALAMCEVLGVDGDELERDEMERVLSLPESFVREKHDAKVRQGLALPF
jgi:NTP pyrophosphatase (non-canonical NTP hydrolase)